NRNVGIATGIGIAIILGVIIFQINGTMWEQVSVDEYYEKGGKVAGVVHPDNPQLLGPLQINKDKYLLGENIYVIIKDLRPQDKGSVEFYTPGGVLYDTMGFNGEQQEFQKKYFKPQLLKSKNLCQKEDLTGQWTVMFRGYDMAVINFEMLPDVLPNQEGQYVGCTVAYEVDLLDP
ncbi:hypothetical protein OAJ88_02170, partial [Candidatus Nitrosopelagicus sp.]|nr:hypothetical protein [Candidatus Nitrosopelagicus sp.]